MTGILQPLDQQFAIVDANGKPTQYFIRWAQQRQIDIGDSINLTDLQDYLAAHMLREGSGIQFTPDGNLNNSPLIAADVQEILDQLTATRGAVLYRGLLGWSALLPGNAGYFLMTGGAGADPAWAPGSGGIPTPPYRSSRIQANASAASYAVALPAGAVAGDLCILIHTGGFGGASITAPATAIWQVYTYAGTNWGGTVFSRVLTAADIAAGSVTITPTGSFNSVVIGICFQGPGIVHLPPFIRSPGAGVVSSVTETDGSLLATDYLIAIATNRGASNNTSTFGALLQTVNAANGSGALYGALAGATFISSTFAYSVAGTGRTEGFIAIRGQ